MNICSPFSQMVRIGVVAPAADRQVLDQLTLIRAENADDYALRFNIQ
jgi:hypothetical protein